jgi:hypothetical protein
MLKFSGAAVSPSERLQPTCMGTSTPHGEVITTPGSGKVRLTGSAR